MTVWKPETSEQVTDIVVSALAERRKLSVSGHGTKAGLGHPVDAQESLSLKNLNGLVDYQPEELVLVVKAGTPLNEIEEILSEKTRCWPLSHLILNVLRNGRHRHNWRSNCDQLVWPASHISWRRA